MPNDKGFLVLFSKKEQQAKGFFLKKEAKTFAVWLCPLRVIGAP
jgi:hypothetical protein